MAEPSDSTTAAPAAPASPPQHPAVAQPAPTPAPAEAADEGTYADDSFSREQLIRHARTLLGAEPFVVEVALRHAGGADFFTVEDAKAAVETLLQHEAGE